MLVKKTYKWLYVGMADRRRFLARVGEALAAILGTVIAVPALAFLSAPLRRRRVEAQTEGSPVLPLDRLQDGKPVRVTLRVERARDAWNALENVTLGSAFLVRDGDKVTAFSTVCPHAGCAVDWESEHGTFACPCHGSVFSRDGKTQSGPSPRALDSLPCQVREGKVFVTPERYRTGVSDKESV